jgi:hypothetical protein
VSKVEGGGVVIEIEDERGEERKKRRGRGIWMKSMGTKYRQ